MNKSAPCSPRRLCGAAPGPGATGPAALGTLRAARADERRGTSQRPDKIMFHFKALLWESIIVLLPPPTCKAYPPCNAIASPFRNIRPPTDPLLYAIHHTILAMTILCKGQHARPPLIFPMPAVCAESMNGGVP